MPEATYKTAKAFAKEHEMPLTEVMRRALDEFFSRRPGAFIKEEWVFPEGQPLEMKENIDWSAVKDDLYLRDPFKNRDEQ